MPSRSLWITRGTRKPPSRRNPGSFRVSGVGRWVSDQPDHAVVEAPPAVNDAGLSTVRVVEQVEVVSDQLHLVESLVDGHGGGRVFLLPDDPAGQVLVLG